MTDFMELEGVKYKLDHKGYLVDMYQWDQKIGDWFANQEGIELSHEHHEIIEYLRSYFEEHKKHPSGRMITKALIEIFGREKETVKYFNELFPGGFHQAYKIAGLPMQHSCC